MKQITRFFLVFFILAPVIANSQFDKEIDSLKKLLPNEKASIEKIDHFFWLSEKLYVVNDYKQELVCLDSALKLSEKLNYQQGLARYKNEYGKIAYIEGNYPDALDNYLSALKIAEKTGDSITVSKVCTNLAVVYSTQGKGDTALGYSHRSLTIAEELKDTSLLLRGYDKQAFVYRNMGNFEQAIEIYEKAIHMAELSGDRYQYANITMNLGIVYKFQENYTKALEVFLQGYPYFDSLGKPEILLPIENCVGTIYLHQNEYPEALKYLNSALQNSLELNRKSEIAINLNLLSEVNLKLKNYNEALQEAEQALQIYTEIQEHYGTGNALLNIGKVYEASGNLDKAMINYKKALKVSEEVNAKENISSALFGIGAVFYKQAASFYPKKHWLNYLSASDSFKSSLKLSLEMGQQEKIMKTYHYLYKIDSATENYLNALENFKLYKRYSDSINGTEIKMQLAQSEYNFLREQKNKEIVLLTKDNEIKSLQLKQQKTQRDGLLIITGFVILLGALIIRSIRLRKKIEKQKAVSLERERISADLHDDIGSGLSKIILMSEVLKNENGPPEVKNKLKEISKESIELSKNISEVIWALNSRNDFLDNLIAYIRKFSSSYFENSAINFKMVTSRQIPKIPISSEQRRNIFLVVKEALHNIVKHSEATEAEISVSIKGQNLSIRIKDNGIGIHDKNSNHFGNGLIQMKKRLETIGGEFTFENKQGTTIHLSVPV